MIGDLIRARLEDAALRAGMPAATWRTLRLLAACGTPAAGLHQRHCDDCHAVALAPNSCGDRNCPRCQGGRRLTWTAEREAELLPVGYVHVVVTLPDALRALAAAYPRAVLNALLSATGAALLDLMRERHGALPAALLTLHTWTQDLRWHPHVHAVVSAGGWSTDARTSARWIDVPPGRDGRPFLLPGAQLGIAVARRFGAHVRRAWRDGDLTPDPARAAEWPHLTSATAFAAWLAPHLATRWVVHLQPPFGSANQVVRYLGRYVARTAISDARVTDHGDGTVTIATQARDAARTAVPVRLSADDFIRRFARHIPPPRLVRTRFIGLWAARHRDLRERARTFLHQHGRRAPSAQPPAPCATPPPPGTAVCPHCGALAWRMVPGTRTRPPPMRPPPTITLHATDHAGPDAITPTPAEATTRA
jgi:hypothetical protein